MQLTIPATIQASINVVQPPPTPVASRTIVPPAYHHTKHVQQPIHQMASDISPPLPAQMRRKIIQDWMLQATGSECSRPSVNADQSNLFSNKVYNESIHGWVFKTFSILMVIGNRSLEVSP